MKKWKAPEMTEIEVRDTFTGTHTNDNELAKDPVTSSQAYAYFAPKS